MHIHFDRYESRKGHKSNHNNHQHRGKKSDQVSSSVADDKHTNARSNRSNEKISSAETLAKDIEQASTIRPQGKCTINHQIFFNKMTNMQRRM